MNRESEAEETELMHISFRPLLLFHESLHLKVTSELFLSKHVGRAGNGPNEERRRWRYVRVAVSKSKMSVRDKKVEQ